ncbi:MAG: hypothetical protein PF517_11205 [Salinivirgaceae bacterium]|nr:hypothetical protein [Salinivirgaceae bacterium]
MLKVSAILHALIILFFILQTWVIDMDVVFKSFFKNTPFHLVFVIFTISESIFGLITPDFFILWSTNFEHTWLIISVLAVLSYTGGLVSYHIGFQIRQIKKTKPLWTESTIGLTTNEIRIYYNKTLDTRF